MVPGSQGQGRQLITLQLSLRGLQGGPGLVGHVRAHRLTWDLALSCPVLPVGRCQNNGAVDEVNCITYKRLGNFLN